MDIMNEGRWFLTLDMGRQGSTCSRDSFEEGQEGLIIGGEKS